LLFCTGSPLYFCEFLLIYNIAQYNIAQYFLWQMKPFPWMFSRVDGAYYGKILICAPMSCQRRGLLRQNPYLCPDIPLLTGLITAKFLICAPISCQRRGLLRQNSYLRPDIPVSTGLITAKSLSTPRYPGIDGAYYGKIPFCAPMSCQRRGLLRQNPYLCPDIPVSTGLITAKSLSVPRYSASDGAYYGKILICAPMYKGGGYNRPGLVSHTRVCESRWV
jgi:hypothetical protein